MSSCIILCYFDVWYCIYCILETSCKTFDSGVVFYQACISDFEGVNSIFVVTCIKAF